MSVLSSTAYYVSMDLTGIANSSERDLEATMYQCSSLYGSQIVEIIIVYNASRSSI